MNYEQATQETRTRYADFLKPAKKAGTYICPLCGNGTGSTGDGMSIDPHGDGLRLHCFKCGFHGDIIDLYQKENGCTMPEAVKALSRELNITIDTEQSTQAQRTEAPRQRNAEQKPAPNTPPTNYTNYYSECLERLDNPQALEYLNKRGISKTTAQLFFIGYDPEWRSPQAIRNGKTPPSSPRLIIPTSDYSYLARDTRPQLTESEKKFAKMKEGEVQLFHKEYLNGSGEEPLFITEGEIDAISIVEAGAQAMALGSTSNYKKLLEELKEHPTKSTLILTLDNDEAGKKATKNLADGLTELNISYVIADISGEYKDPNEALTADRNAFIKAIRQAEHQTATKPDNLGDYLQRSFKDDIEAFKKSNHRKTGFEHLDYKAGGIYTGLYVLGAISSLGKTTFIHQIADQLATAGEHVLFFSLEQSRFEMVSKSLSRIIKRHNPTSETTSLDIRKGKGNEEELERAFNEYAVKISDRLSIIEGNFNCNIAFICDYVKRYIEKNKVKPVVIIDYLQILDGDPKQKLSTKEATDINVRELKRMSRNNDIPVMVVSSINRNNYLTPIDFESFKESGGIEYTADVVWGLQLEAITEDLFNSANKIKEKRERVKEAKAENPRKVQLVCLKNRYGISNYTSEFLYYPANDLYKEKDLTGQSFKKSSAKRTI